jgi:6-phosphogluconolactonase
MEANSLIYLGTYTRGASRGIYSVRLNRATGALSEATVAAETGNPTYLAFSPDRRTLYAVRDTASQAAAFAIDAGTGSLKSLSTAPSPAGIAPCHIAADRTGKTVVVANYHDPFVATLAVLADGSLGPPRIIRHAGRGHNPERQDMAHVHSANISPDNRYVLVCDLGLDKVFTYQLDAAGAKLTPAATPFAVTAPGAGPRHMVYADGGRRAYVINEIDSTIGAYTYDAAGGTLAVQQVISTLPADFTGKTKTAEIALHPNGKFLYGSNRGHDSIAVFAVAAGTGALTLVEITPCGGVCPRCFALSPDGAWLVCANQDSNNLTTFRVDPGTGRLTPVGKPVAVPEPVCVLFYN